MEVILTHASAFTLGTMMGWLLFSLPKTRQDRRTTRANNRRDRKS